jgi:hypothetical protein
MNMTHVASKDMRALVVAVVVGTAATFAAQGTDPAGILTPMRQALGGDAALDAVQSFSVTGTVTTKGAGFTSSLPFELFALLPDHYMIVRRDVRSTGPMTVDVTYKLQDGFNWPRRLTHIADGEVIDETKFGKFKINPDLKPKKFDIR